MRHQPDGGQRHHQQRDRLRDRSFRQVFGGRMPVRVVDAGNQAAFRWIHEGLQSFTERNQQRLQHSGFRGIRASEADHSK